ncbi:hypothetical protein ASE21_14895 [Flavobacterium sp. Root901]|uniref:hypothetical protein n=1 Tax=Flavobacterium sp. Root901 TaxID=1736605 RepID=UPI00070E19AB|nr:hypothetical protein [Flavobacterium sp. Root901]KRD09132.1 hypothetical protein ASE21_14895 [Flavobacterium sp. Root901]
MLELICPLEKMLPTPSEGFILYPRIKDRSGTISPRFKGTYPLSCIVTAEVLIAVIIEKSGTYLLKFI